MKSAFKNLGLGLCLSVITGCSSVQQTEKMAVIGGAGAGGAAIGSVVSSNKNAPLVGAAIGAGGAYLYMSESERKEAAKRQEYIDLGIATALQRHYLLLNDRAGETPKNKTYYYSVPAQETDSDGTQRAPQTVTIPIVE